MTAVSGVVENSSNPFLAPWGGFLPCNDRADCSSNHPLWSPYKALCEPLAGHSTLPGYYGYCRCTTWLFRHGEVCETLTSTASIYYLLELLLVLPQIICCSVLVAKLWVLYRARYTTLRAALLNMNSILLYACCLSILGQFMSEVAVTYLYLVQTPQDEVYKFEVFEAFVLADILVFLQIPVFTTIASYTIIANQFFVMAGKWLKGAQITVFNPMLVVSTILTTGAVVVWITVTLLGKYYNFALVYAILILFLGFYFAITINRVIVILKKYKQLQVWADALTYRLKVLLVCNTLTILFHLIACVAAILPKTLSTTEADFPSFASVFFNFALLFPLNGLLYFLLGVYQIAHGTSETPCTSTGESEPGVLHSIFQTAAEYVRGPSSAGVDRVVNQNREKLWNSESVPLEKQSDSSNLPPELSEKIMTVC